MVCSFPQTLKKLAMIYSEKIGVSDVIAGVPMGGIHLATAISLNLNRPMIIPRLKKKDHGLGKSIEGHFRKEQRVCIIEDIMSTGLSALRTLKTLQKSGLQVTQIVSFLWYLPSKEVRLAARGSFRITTLTNIRQVLETLHSYRAISRDLWFNTLARFRRRGTVPLIKYPPVLKQIVKKKKSLLVIALDTSWNECKRLISILSPYACAFKFHYDLLSKDPTFNPKTLMKMAETHEFLVIRDRKCADVAKINKELIGSGETQHITIVHALPGVTSFPPGPLIVILEMSTTDSMFTPSYMKGVMKRTSNLPNVLGYVSQYKWWSTHRLCFTPGIDITPRIESGNAQRYSSPEAKRSHGCDLFIVGSAIVQSRDPLSQAKKYHKATWNGGLEGVSQDIYNRLLKFSQERGLTIDEGQLKLKEFQTRNKNETLSAPVIRTKEG